MAKAIARSNGKSRMRMKANPSKKMNSRKAGKSLSRSQSKDFSTAAAWPQIRMFMERPERYNYVRKLIKTDGCVFCETLSKGMEYPNLLLHKTAHSMAVLNKFPYNSGHIMILPRRHCGTLTDLSDAEFIDLQKLLREAVKIVDAEYQCKGMNIGLNMGEVAGAGIPAHLHWHVIPRWIGDTNFFPLIAETKVLAETLEQTFNRYRKHFAKLKQEEQ